MTSERGVLRSVAGLATGTGRLLAAWTLLGLGISARAGEFSLYGLAFVLLGLGLLIDVIARRLPLTVPSRRMLALPVGVSLVSAVIHPAVSKMHASSAVGLRATEVLSGLLLLCGAATLRWGSARPSRALIGLSAVAVLTAVVTIRISPDPYIDVWHLLQQSSSGLLHGQDMYRQKWTHSHGLQDVYPYLPITTVLLAPFRWLLGDVRYGLLAATFLAVWLVRRLAPSAPVALAGLLFLYPQWVFLVDQSWTEPLLVGALAVAIWGLREERSWVAVIGLAVALACKQHIVLLLPLFALWPAFGLRRTVWAALAAGVAVLPWFLADPAAMSHDAVQANLDLGVMRRALCLPSLFERGGLVVGFGFLLVALAGAYWLALRRLPRTPSGLALGCALVMWVVDVANKQSFFNHYTLPLALMVIALSAAPSSAPATPAAPASDRGKPADPVGPAIVPGSW